MDVFKINDDDDDDDVSKIFEMATGCECKF